MQKIKSNATFLAKADVAKPQVIVENNHGVIAGSGSDFEKINLHVVGNQTGLIPNKMHYLIKGVIVSMILFILAILGETVSAKHFEVGAAMMVLALLLYIPAYDYFSKAELVKKEQEQLDVK